MFVFLVCKRLSLQERPAEAQAQRQGQFVLAKQLFSGHARALKEGADVRPVHKATA